MAKEAFAIMTGLFMYQCAQFIQTIDVQPAASKEDCICPKNDTECYCTLVIEYKLTMLLDNELVYPDNGKLRLRANNSELGTEHAARVITADGQTSRLVITVNGRFPGPRIEVYEGQLLHVKVVNNLYTEGVSIHFHGLPQKSTPWMDGVAYVTQCPVMPGQTFEHVFHATPPGTYFYHSHLGGQRFMGLYGPLIIRPKMALEEKEIIISLQEWNNELNSQTAHERAITQQFNFKTNEVIPSTFSVDGAGFERFAFQSGLMNGKGRFWTSLDSNNGSPLERFKIRAGTRYRFRVIGAMYALPMRIFIYGQRINLRSSDAYNINQLPVQSIVIHPGERYDFYWQSPEENSITSKEVLIIAKTLETPQSLNFSKYHAAEAVLEFEDFVGTAQSPNPKNTQDEVCLSELICPTFNCPFKYYPKNESRECISYNEVENIDPNQHYTNVVGDKVDEEHFFNFGFPGPDGNTPASINGRRFYLPTVSLLTQRHEKLSTSCNKSCETNGVCHCTHIQKIPSQKIVQFVLLDLGSGSGASHPIHLHGHSFYVMKTGYGTYNLTTGKLVQNSNAINCTDKFNYCSTAAWANSSWSGGNVPGMNPKPPQKDTIILPTGGYVVIRFVTDNPGMWFFHCHIDVHNQNGMAMVIEEGDSWPSPPKGFPICRSFLDNGEENVTSAGRRKSDTFLVIVTTAIFYSNLLY
ncbi:uncharacterized protein LOC132731827 [Ruditapes philippinarum]|uniref:uncharacterized protein LOC132731827 n=1 Tax=Ruditapes philippinarum TaxID=129788 RepID=UPI00295B5085|nr:uncharacterized protein LOC132731827 [Ruditapes philippinarum]